MDRTKAETRARAEMMFKAKQEQARDKPVAISDYKAAEEHRRENMERLRKLRLARQIS